VTEQPSTSQIIRRRKSRQRWLARIREAEAMNRAHTMETIFLAARRRAEDEAFRERMAQVPGPYSAPSKQETPEVGASEASTDRNPLGRDNDGCSAKSAR
jgi:hypothetical protein